MHKLVFTMELAITQKLIYGNLQLVYPDRRAIDYIATSGCAQWQQFEDRWARARGPIPTGFAYQIPTKPYWLETKGIEGWFFHITPDPVISPDGGVVRGEFGIHFEANTPGSAGCIVLVKRTGWERFCSRMEAIAKSGIDRIPPKVVYL